MTSSPDNTVEEILVNLVSQALNSEYWQTDTGDDSSLIIIEDRAKQSLDSHYLGIFLELVGEDDHSLLEAHRMDNTTMHRNQLRQELRTALQDRLGGKNE